MRNIKKTIKSTTVNAHKLVMVDGNPTIEPIVMRFIGEMSEPMLRKAVFAEHGTAVQFGEITVSESVYEMSVATFIEHATKI